MDLGEPVYREYRYRALVHDRTAPCRASRGLADHATHRKRIRTPPVRFLQLYALTRNTCAITRLKGSDKVNVLPAKAVAEIDCRLLPDEDAEEFLAALDSIVNEPGAEPTVTITPTMILTPATSSTDTDLQAIVERVVY
jgi:acetylornithine deacetylase/succinyl-diaminopimelate desuccinylase-like protein